MANRPDIQRSCTAFDTSIGITERVTTPSTPWQGIMRHRRTDFLVNEIQKDGTVLHLTNCDFEDPRNNNKPAPAPAAPAEISSQNAPEKPDVPAEDVSLLESLTSKEFAEQLVAMYKGTPSSDGQMAPAISTGLIDDKAKRSQIHQEVRRIFNSEIDTTTDPTGAISASKRRSNRTKAKNTRAKQQQRLAALNCTGEGDFLHFTMFKENRDTMEAVGLLSRMLGLKGRSSMQVAGTKDRRAATVQRVSARLRSPLDLSRLNPRLYGIKTGDYAYSREALHLGQLRGNEFTITVKDCRTPQDEGRSVAERVAGLQASIGASLKGMHERGWINYFGHQRFGSFATGTNKIGMMIFSGRLEDAVAALLEYDPKVLETPPDASLPKSSPRHDEYNRAAACHVFKTERDAAKALKQMPRRFSAETTIINHLGRSMATAKDYAGALLNLPRGLRTLYLHAYQSYVWNHAASKRWALYGSKAVEGDLVVVADAPDTSARPETDQDGGEVVYASSGPAEEEDADEAALAARPLTAEEASSGKYTIFDVLLPTVGTTSVLPGNEVGAFYREFMGREENGGLDPLDMPKSHKEFSAAGRYRPLIARFLSEPSVEVRAYADDDEQMCPTDWDLLQRKAEEERRLRGEQQKQKNQEGKRGLDEEERSSEPAAKKAKIESEGGEALAPKTDAGSAEEPRGADEGQEADAEVAGKDEPPKNKVAAILRFQLGRSAYATVAIREMGLAPEEKGQTGTKA